MLFKNGVLRNSNSCLLNKAYITQKLMTVNLRWIVKYVDSAHFT